MKRKEEELSPQQIADRIERMRRFREEHSRPLTGPEVEAFLDRGEMPPPDRPIVRGPNAGKYGPYGGGDYSARDGGCHAQGRRRSGAYTGRKLAAGRDD